MISVTVPVDGRPYYFQVDGTMVDGKPYINHVYTDTGTPADDIEIEFVMLAWKEYMFYAIRIANE